MTTNNIQEVSHESGAAAQKTDRKHDENNSFLSVLLAARPADNAEHGPATVPDMPASPDTDGSNSRAVETTASAPSGNPEQAPSKELTPEAAGSAQHSPENEQTTRASVQSGSRSAENGKAGLEPGTEQAGNGKLAAVREEWSAGAAENPASPSSPGRPAGNVAALQPETGTAGEKSWNSIVKGIEIRESTAGGSAPGESGSNTADEGGLPGKGLNPEAELETKTGAPNREALPSEKAVETADTKTRSGGEQVAGKGAGASSEKTGNAGETAEAGRTGETKGAGEGAETRGAGEAGKAGETGDETVKTVQANGKGAASPATGAAGGSGTPQSVAAETPPAEELIPFRNADVEEMFKAGRLAVLRNGKEARLVLHPPELGKLRIRLYTGRNRSAARFVVETPEAREALLAGESLLREAFDRHGLEIEEFEVLVINLGSDGENGRYEDEDGSEKDGSLTRKQSSTENNASFMSSKHPSGLINIYA